MKRIKMLLACLLALLFVCAGCGRTAPAANQSITTDGKPVRYLQNDIHFDTKEQTVSEGELFRVQFEGDAVAGTAGVVDGKYRVTATKTDGEAWHIKLESNYPTVPGNDYRITYTFISDVAGRVKFGDVQEFPIKAGQNEVTGVVTAKNGTTYLDFQLGMLDPFTIDFEKITVAEFADEATFISILPSAVPFESEQAVYEQHDDGFEQTLERAADGVTANVANAPANGDVWNSKLFIRTGAVPEPGKHYLISADIAAEKEMDFEICLNNGDEEKGYGALYGQRLTETPATFVQTVSIPKTGFDAKEVVLQLMLGKSAAGNRITVKNVNVEEINDSYRELLPADFAMDKSIAVGTATRQVPDGYKEIPLNGFSFTGTDTTFEGHDDGYVIEMNESADGVDMKIVKAPENADDRGVWKARLFVNTGVEPEAGKIYRVSYDLTPTADQSEYEVCFDGDEEKAYGALYGRPLTAGTADHVEYTFSAAEPKGVLKLKFQLGKTNGAEGNTFALRNFKFEELTTEFKDILPAEFAYPEGSGDTTVNNSFDLETNNGTAAALTGDGSSATATVTTPGDDWHIKLYAKPGLDLEANETYTITMDVTGASGCTACYKNVATGAEDGFGTEAIGSGTVTHTVTPTEGGRLEILLKIGNVPAGTAVMVKNIHITKTTTDYIPMELSGFGYPVTTGGGTETVPAGYVAQPLSVSANAVAWDESEASASASGSSATLRVTKARTSGGMWSVRLEVNTGVALEKDAQYQVSGTLTSEKGNMPFEVLYSNGSGTDEGPHNPGGQGYAEGSWGLRVDNDGGSASFSKTFTVPERSEYRPLVLRVQVGDTPAPNTITVSNIQVKKWVPEHEETTEPSTENRSFDLEANSGAEAALTGDGSSATATVTTPGADWNVKLYAKPNVTLETGKTYRISMNVSGASGCTACYKNLANGNEEGFGTEKIGNGTVTHIVTPAEDGVLELMLKIGNVSAGTEVTVSGIQIAEFAAGELDVTPDSFAYPVTTPGSVAYRSFDLETNMGAAATLTGDGSSAVTTVTAPGDDWHIKLYAKPGVELKAGETYRISMDVTGADGCTACFKNTATGAEDGFGTEAIGSGTVTHTVTPTEDGTMEILLKLGTVPAGGVVTVKNVKLEQSVAGEATNVIDDLQFDSEGYINDAADAGYVTEMTQSADSVVYRIVSAPEERNPWNVKLFVKTGFTPEKNKGYRISFDIASEKKQDVLEVFYDGNSEACYGQLFGQSLSGGKKTVSYTMNGGESKGELVIQIRLGKTDGTDGNAYTVSNVKIEEVKFKTEQVDLTQQTVTSFIHNEYQATLDRTAENAAMTLSSTPENAEAWKTKLFVHTGAKFQAGGKYRVRFDVNAEKETGYEVCFNHGNEEKGLGAMYGLTAGPRTQTVTYTVYATRDIDLVIQLSLGNCAAPNTVTISNVHVEEAGELIPVSETVYTFH